MYLSVYLLEESLKGFTDIVPSLCTYFKEILDLMVICKLQLEHYSHTAICPSIPIYTNLYRLADLLAFFRCYFPLMLKVKLGAQQHQAHIRSSMLRRSGILISGVVHKNIQ